MYRLATTTLSGGLRVHLLIVILLLLACWSTVQTQGLSKPTLPQDKSSARAPQIRNSDGISVEFSIDPISAEKRDRNELLAGTEAQIRFKIVEVTGGKSIRTVRPAAWIDRRISAQAPNATECREKVQQFLQPSFSKRPTADLNSYFVLALNHESNISVIDPLSGFGGSKLYTLIALNSSGEDWVMSADKRRLYVSMPAVNQVAVINLQTWKVVTNIDAGTRPSRVALQPDGRYLWVGNDASSESDAGVTVVDTETLNVAARISTGLGHHEIAFAENDSLAFVTNKQAGTLSVIDIRKLAKAADVKVGSMPSSVVVSALSKSVYVGNEGDGTIVAVDASRFEILARMKGQPGLQTLRISPEGRFGFAVNPVESTVNIFDVSANRLVHQVPVGLAADQISFTRDFAYVRSTGSEFVTMIKTSTLEKEASVSRFPAGQHAPKDSRASSLANAIVPGPESGSVLVANPADKMIYFYTEGMAAPMGSFQNYRRDPKALLILDNGLRETAGGVYTTTVRLNDAGYYDVAFLLNSPRVVSCFNFAVAENPELVQQGPPTIKIVPTTKETTLRVGERHDLRFKVVDSNSNE
ncbi:MAG TPA: cytochrome D1 domain-containing protein, partial [Pyrinomonadaceae bacterium]|nr:cytochrome D1 domain-containing protein [Pyrinomonadaceae bacterium]